MNAGMLGRTEPIGRQSSITQRMIHWSRKVKQAQGRRSNVSMLGNRLPTGVCGWRTPEARRVRQETHGENYKSGREVFAGTERLYIKNKAVIDGLTRGHSKLRDARYVGAPIVLSIQCCELKAHLPSARISSIVSSDFHSRHL